MDQWGPWFLYGLFFAILVWEEVWTLNDTAYLSAWLLLIITAGAMLCSAFFERRMWCRYLCPIGGMNGMFAKLSMTEVRGREGVCAGKHPPPGRVEDLAVPVGDGLGIDSWPCQTM